MMSTESPTQNQQQQQQQQQSTVYDERVFNERIRQLFNSIDSSSISHSPLSSHGDIGHMTSIVDALFPEQASFHQQREQRHASTNDLTTALDRFPLWNNNNNNNNKSNSSASAFCGGTTNGSSAFVNRRQSKLHSSSRSLRNTNYHCQQQQQNHYRPPPLTRPRFASSAIRLQSAITTTTPNNNSTNGLQRSSSSLSTNNSICGTTDYQPRFASRLSSSRLPTAAPPVGSYDQIASNNITIDPIVPPSATSTIGVMNQPSSASAGLARSTSSANAQPQQFVTMTQTTTTTFCYVPASGSLAYNNLSGTNRNATISHH
ncbi:unnamed protein product [Rotaria sordida]|uniref:Uncharacterized protein n=1 Tax=Rotaria sordida TaxID=392033 RepID=A0A819K8A2_9BILA|nr:unnamed protein product [Rotaria sordida]CAF3941499.1 unnamed protein product [Rotaria sordida]